MGYQVNIILLDEVEMQLKALEIAHTSKKTLLIARVWQLLLHDVCFTVNEKSLIYLAPEPIQR